MTVSIIHYVDPITDEDSYAASWPSEDGRAEFHVTCDQKKQVMGVEMVLLRGLSFGQTGSLTDDFPLTYRIDKMPPVTMDWRHLEERAWMTKEKPTVQLLLDLPKAGRMVVRADASFWGNETEDFAFPIDAPTPSIGRMRLLCPKSSIAIALASTPIAR